MLFGVLGADRTFLEYLNVNAQYLVRTVPDYRAPGTIADPTLRSLALQNAAIGNQFGAVRHGLSLRIGHKWLNETLEAEIQGVSYFAPTPMAWCGRRSRTHSPTRSRPRSASTISSAPAPMASSATTGASSPNCGMGFDVPPSRFVIFRLPLGDVLRLSHAAAIMREGFAG